ncbi:hypothetical protein LX32DRAFT_33101 [Colletotrichum zoysiae]|uniref:Uncharacterized protein n=1 Tax=Colletotrichum zoysiae TaxID=1216348 RepID=A0AAD9HE01_9PEZI|nr:hypothetical protein LX32DRAFT_33101 [Colletotrichum zoysiae]
MGTTHAYLRNSGSYVDLRIKTICSMSTTLFALISLSFRVQVSLSVISLLTRSRTMPHAPPWRRFIHGIKDFPDNALDEISKLASKVKQGSGFHSHAAQQHPSSVRSFFGIRTRGENGKNIALSCIPQLLMQFFLRGSNQKPLFCASSES